jgi:uncharacterized protein
VLNHLGFPWSGLSSSGLRSDWDPVELQQIIWIVVCVAVAAFAQSLAGFGFGLLSVPMMALVLAPRDAIVVSVLVASVSTSTQAIVDRRFTEWKTVRRLSLLSYAGMPFGLIVFNVVSERSLRFGLGVVVLVATVLIVRKFQIPEEARGYDWILGFISGVLNTSTSTNGPPLVFLLKSRAMEAHTFRATLNTVFSIANIGALILFFGSGKLSQDNVIGAAFALPALAIALRFGYAMRKRVHEDAFTTLVAGLMLLSGASALVAALA